MLTIEPTSKSVRATLYDASGNLITSQASGGQRALDVGVNVAGVQVDPRAIRALTSSDQITAIAAPSDGIKATYSASISNLTVAASATNIVTIQGSASKVVRIVRVLLSGIQTASGNMTVLLRKQSTADTGGTSSAMTAIPHDSSSAAATASAVSYTANPTMGSLVGVPVSKRVSFPAAAAAFDPAGDLYRADLPAQAIVLRGVAQGLAVGFNGVTLTGGSVNVSLTWTEE